MIAQAADRVQYRRARIMNWTKIMKPVAATEVVFLVAGADKAEAVERAFAKPPSPDTPSSLARGRRTVAYLDAAAAARLSR